MSERENDIEFDFFEEPDTRETEERPRRRGPRPPVRPPTGLTPLLRLIGLISFAILIVLLLVVWVNGCREDQRKDAYRDYVEDVQGYATQSQRLGRRLNTLLTTRGTQESEVQSELSGLAAQQAVADRPADHPCALPAHNAEFERYFLQRFVASDVLWEDLFREPTRSELDNLDITGVVVPGSAFLRNPDIATSASMKSVWQRIHGAATGGANCEPRGTGIVSTKVLPSNRELSTETTNTVQLSTDLTFSVTIQNSGCAQEVGLKIRLTIQQSPRPITAQRTVDLVDPGDEQTVEFTDLGLPELDQKTSLTVEVEPVPGESNTDNNTENYPVQFSVG